MRNAADEAASALEGTFLANRYELSQKLGKGGMAFVYRAHDTVLGREVAIKVVSEECAIHDTAMKRFVREARTMASLDSAHIVPLYDVGKDGNHTFLVMKLMVAPVLDHLIRQKGHLEADVAARLMAQVLVGLGHLHEKGVVHRDVKPSNILVDDTGYAMLLDLGIAFDPSAAGLTADGIILGTPSYISPEQVAGTPVDGRSDLYSAGVVLFEMLTGELPFIARTQVEACLMHLKRPAPSPREVRPEIPEAVAQVVLKALAKRPEDRYQTGLEMRYALLAAVGEPTTLTGERPAFVPPRAPEPAPARTAPAVAAAAPEPPAAFSEGAAPAPTGGNAPRIPEGAKPATVFQRATPLAALRQVTTSIMQRQPLLLPAAAMALVLIVVLAGVGLAALRLRGAGPDSTAILAQGQGLIAEGEAEEAAAAAQDALARDPACADCYAVLGDAAEHLGDTAGAVGAWRRYLEMSPRGSEAERLKGRLSALGGALPAPEPAP